MFKYSLLCMLSIPSHASHTQGWRSIEYIEKTVSGNFGFFFCMYCLSDVSNSLLPIHNFLMEFFSSTHCDPFVDTYTFIIEDVCC